MRGTFALMMWCAVWGFSQGPADTKATFSSKVNLVSVPVVVRDKNGNAVGNLTKEDFQLFDKGRSQEISKFATERADGRVTPIEVRAAGLEAKTPEGPAMASRFVIYLFDDIHMRFGDLAQAREAAIKHLERMQAADRAAIYTTSGQGVQDFTDDKAKLKEALGRITPRSRQNSGAQCPEINDYQADMIVNRQDVATVRAVAQEMIACPARIATSLKKAEQLVPDLARQVANVAEGDTQISLSVLKATVQRLTVMPGQRTMVLVSSGFLVTNKYLAEESDIVDRAVRSSVTISTLDARGLYTLVPGGDASTPHTSVAASLNRTQYEGDAARARSEVLGELADGTGGTFFHNSNDLEDGFRRTGAAPEFVYMLGFTPDNLKSDGSFHALKVTAKNTRGVTLNARRGYYAPKHATDAKQDAKEEIRVALFSREQMSDIPVSVHTAVVKSDVGKSKLSVLAQVGLKNIGFKKVEGLNENTLSVVSALFDRNGVLVSAVEKDVEMRFKDDVLEARIAAGVEADASFDIPPGSYRMRLVVRDSEGQTMSARDDVLEIP